MMTDTEGKTVSNDMNDTPEKKGFNHQGRNKPIYKYLIRSKVWTGKGNQDFNYQVNDLNELDKKFVKGLDNDSGFIKIDQCENKGEIFNVQVKEGWELVKSQFRLQGSKDWQENKHKIQGLGKYKMTFVKVTQNWAKKIMVSFTTKNQSGNNSIKTIHFKNPKELDKLFDQAILDNKDTFEFNEFNIIVKDGWNISRIDYVERNKNSKKESSSNTNNTFKALEDLESQDNSLNQDNSQNQESQHLKKESEELNETIVLDEQKKINDGNHISEEEYPSLHINDDDSEELNFVEIDTSEKKCLNFKEAVSKSPTSEISDSKTIDNQNDLEERMNQISKLIKHYSDSNSKNSKIDNFLSKGLESMIASFDAVLPSVNN